MSAVARVSAVEHDKMVELRKGGMVLKAIAAIFGFSLRTVHTHTRTARSATVKHWHTYEEDVCSLCGATRPKPKGVRRW